MMTWNLAPNNGPRCCYESCAFGLRRWEEVQEHTVRWGAQFQFVCKMSANASTGVLDPCVLRVSVRKELKGGRSFQKLGFTDLNLAEFAGAGKTTRRCLLEGYDTRHRQDNSVLRLTIGMNLLAGDILFKVPSPSLKHKTVAPPSDEITERRDDFSSGSLAGSIASGSSGFGSLPKKRTPLFSSELMSGPGLGIPDAGEPSVGVGVGVGMGVGTGVGTGIGMGTGIGTGLGVDGYGAGPGPGTTTLGPETDEAHELGHSRNSSNTSQMSRASGYSSLNSQSQHSRQSSSGDSGHIRNPSSGSGLSETGSLDRAKAALERRKKAVVGAEDGTTGGGRVEGTRVNPDSLIDELLRQTNLEQPDELAETSGLKLFIAKDGTTTLGSHEVKSQLGAAGLLKQVVMDTDNR